jgi:hypothetical protein
MIQSKKLLLINYIKLTLNNNLKAKNLKSFIKLEYLNQFYNKLIVKLKLISKKYLYLFYSKNT